MAVLTVCSSEQNMQKWTNRLRGSLSSPKKTRDSIRNRKVEIETERKQHKTQWLTWGTKVGTWNIEMCRLEYKKKKIQEKSCLGAEDGLLWDITTDNIQYSRFIHKKTVEIKNKKQKTYHMFWLATFSNLLKSCLNFECILTLLNNTQLG